MPYRSLAIRVQRSGLLSTLQLKQNGLGNIQRCVHQRRPIRTVRRWWYTLVGRLYLHVSIVNLTTFHMPFVSVRQVVRVIPIKITHNRRWGWLQRYILLQTVAVQRTPFCCLEMESLTSWGQEAHKNLDKLIVQGDRPWGHKADKLACQTGQNWRRSSQEPAKHTVWTPGIIEQCPVPPSLSVISHSVLQINHNDDTTDSIGYGMQLDCQWHWLRQLRHQRPVLNSWPNITARVKY